MALRISLIYAAFGTLWIFWSDKFLASVFSDTETLTQFQTYKGWLYVGITFVLLLHLMRRAFAVQESTEHKLRESGLRYREVFENTSDGLFLLDVTEDMRFRIDEFNPAEERMIGYSIYPRWRVNLSRKSFPMRPRNRRSQNIGTALNRGP